MAAIDPGFRGRSAATDGSECQGPVSGAECCQFRAKPGSEHDRPVRHRPFAAEPDRSFRRGAPGLDPGTGDRSGSEGETSGIPRRPRAGSSRLKDKRVGRFGWKGANGIAWRDFVLTACASSWGLRLEVPGHHQGGVAPRSPMRRPKAWDLASEECNSLTSFIRELPRSVGANAGNRELKPRKSPPGVSCLHTIGCTDLSHAEARRRRRNLQRPPPP